MAYATRPVRSPRRLYKIPNLVRRKASATETESTVGDGFVLMKQSVADWLGDTCKELDYDDPLWFYTRTVGGQEVQFRKNLGGYKSKNITLTALNGIELQEYILDPETGDYSTEPMSFRSITIGLPAGASMSRMIAFLATTDKLSQIDKIVTYDKRAIYVNVQGMGTVAQ